MQHVKSSRARVGWSVAAALAFGLSAHAPVTFAADTPVVSECWATPDDIPVLYRFLPVPGAPTAPTVLPTVKNFDGEGMFYRAKTNSIGLFMDAPARLWYYDLATKAETEIPGEMPGHVEAAAYYVNPADPSDERVWIVTGAKKLERIDPATGEIKEGPIVPTGFEGTIGGFAIDPLSGAVYFTDDHPESELWRMDPTTYAATKVSTLILPDGAKPDAESLDFDSSGNLYTEEDQGDDKSVPEFSRYLYSINIATGALTKAAGPFPGEGDVEGVACNGGAAAFAAGPVVPTPAAIDIEKFVNDADADTAPGVIVAEASPVTFRYDVTNTGGVALRDVVVTDDRGVAVTCPSGSGSIPQLAVGEKVSCTGSSTAVRGDYVNVGSVTGQPEAGGAAVTDRDEAHYVGWPLQPLPETGSGAWRSTGLAGAVAVAGGAALMLLANRRRSAAQR